MFCYQTKFFSQQKYAIYLLKDEIKLCNGSDILLLQLNSFTPQIRWIKNNHLEISSFELYMNGKRKTFKIDFVLGMLLKEFLNGKVCYQGINNQYKLAKYLSKRAYGSIVRMRFLENDELVTCKIIKQGRSQYEQEFRNEVQALQSLKHKSIVRLKEYYVENFHNYIIYQFVEGMSLDNYIKKKSLQDEQIYYIMKELVQTINYIHKEGFSHQNITIDNIYYCSILNQITIIDFGKSTQGDSYWNNMISSNESHSSKPTKDYQDLCSFTSRGVNPEKDFFDCGLVFYQLITGKIFTTAEIPSLDDDSKIITLITCVQNQKASKILMKLLLLNRSPDKLNKSDEILNGFEELLNLSKF